MLWSADVMENRFSSPFSIYFGKFQNHQACVDSIKIGKNNNEIKTHKNLKNTDSFSLENLTEMNTNLISNDQFNEFGKNLNEEGKGNLINQEEQKLSTEEIMRLAAEKFIQSSCQEKDDDMSSVSMNSYQNDLSDLSMEDLKYVELVQLLLSVAEKISTHQFVRASKLLSRCELMASNQGNPVERIVYYFGEALREKIDKQIGKKSSATKNADRKVDTYDNSIASGSGLEFIAFHQALPFIQACQFAGMQAIVEKIGAARKVHLIDLQLRNGIQWTILIQVLAARAKSQIKALKITAVVTTNKEAIEATCERLASFAKSLKLPFSYKIIFVADMIDIALEQFEVEPDEKVVVYSQSALMLMLPKAGHLDHLMAVISMIKPTLMVIIELEAKQNSPSFVKRFTEALFFHSAYFDCLECCMNGEHKYRIMMEEMYFREGIINIVAADGEERVKRYVTIDVWRNFFERFPMVETQLSALSLNHAKMVTNLFNCESSCTIENNGKGLIVGWKGTPLHSLSTWRFS